MEPEKLQSVLESINLPSDKIDEILLMMKEHKEYLQSPEHKTDQELSKLLAQYEEETNWKKKSAIAARMMSLKMGDL